MHAQYLFVHKMFMFMLSYMFIVHVIVHAHVILHGHGIVLVHVRVNHTFGGHWKNDEA